MTLIEPVAFGAIFSFVFLPIATFGLGFDPHLTWAYVALFGLAPILLTLPAILPAALVFVAILGEPSPLERLMIASAALAASVVTYLVVTHWFYVPETGIRTLSLLASGPFIAGVTISTLGFLVVVAFQCCVNLFKSVSGTSPRQPTA